MKKTFLILATALFLFGCSAAQEPQKVSTWQKIKNFASGSK